MHPDHEGTPRFKSHLVVCTHLTVSFDYEFVHGGGAFVLTCGCGWGLLSHCNVRLEKSLIRAAW